MRKESLKPVEGADRSLRRRLDMKGELVLALLPTATVLGVLALVEALTQQRLLFASLASSAFLIYLDPQHGMNSVRTLVLAQMLAAAVGLAAFVALGPGYLAAALAMVVTIVATILLDAVHPPAVSTALSFALRAGDESNVALFGMAVAITAVLVGLERAALWLLARYAARHPSGA
ncbi:MAG TPA: HPP family protein [Longimicrobium sp.]|nr:HPP family protein [Longimicrobium sp.]